MTILPDPSCLAASSLQEEDCQRSILQALDHGTNYYSNEVPLSKRIQETAQWFETALVPLSSLSSNLGFVEDVLVDCLWLIGSTLTSLPWDPTTTAAAAEESSPSSSSSKQIQAFHPSVRALIVIVRALLASEAFCKQKEKKNNNNNNDNGDSPNITSNNSSFARKLQENWFPYLLEAVDAIRVVGGGDAQGADDLMKRLRQYNTACNYKQQKYSLLQEESEGYAKLMQYLCGSELPPSLSSSLSSSQTTKMQVFWKLVGTFELDPNRVLDLTLDVLESNLHSTQQQQVPRRRRPPTMTNSILWLLDVISESPLDKLPALLRFKLTNHHRTTTATATPTNTTDYILETMALLVRQDLLDLSLLVNDYFDANTTFVSDLDAAYAIYRKKERDRVLALTRVSLSGNAANNGEATPKQIEFREQLREAMQRLRFLEESHNSSSSSTGGEIETNANTNANKNATILSLYRILIQWGEWERVKPMLSPAQWNKLCCLLPESFGSAIIDIAEDRTMEWMECTDLATAQEVSTSHRRYQTPRLVSLPQLPTETTKTFQSPPSLCEFIQSVSDPLNCVLQSGCIVSRPVFYCRLCRVLGALLAQELENSKAAVLTKIPTGVFDFFNVFLVPSLSLFPSNPSLSTEVWSVLKVLEYDIRYKLYEGWKGPGLEKAGLKMGSPKPLPVAEAELVAGKAARYSLKRLSKDNIRDMSRQLAKVTHSNPLVVFASILSQIESYDNMVEVMVEAQRFVNPLGLDVLGHCILGRLSGTTGGGLMINRSRLKADGVNVSQWLQSLEAFAGEFYKARPFVEFRGILFYLMDQLKGGNVMELGMLRTLLKVAAGYGFADYSPAASLNERQLDGRSGSVTLKRETMSFGIVEKTNAVATKNIRSILQTDGLGVSLLILIAQARDRIIFDSGKDAFKEVKLVGNVHDTCQVVMSILLEFLTDSSSEKNGNETKQSEGSDLCENISLYSKFLPPLRDLQDKYGFDTATAWLLCRQSIKAAVESGREQLEHVRESCLVSLPESVGSVLTEKLFEFFYMNTLGDIHTPEELYSSELSRIQEEIKRIQGLKPIPREEAVNFERLVSVSKQLDIDRKGQKERVELTLKSLNEEKSDFFVSEAISKEAAKTFLIHCIYPRMMQGPDDAMYSSAMAFRLFKIWTPGFSIMHYLDELVSIASGALFGVTEAEAANTAILLWQTWKVVNQWRFTEGLYDKEVIGKPGSYMEINEDGEANTTPVSHKEFIELYNQWQHSLAAALVGCLKSNEYIHTRTGLVVLSRLVDVFPTGPTLGNKLLKVLEPLQDETSSRPDIRASANAYGMMLLKARDEGKWVEEDEAEAKARADKEKAAAEERKKKIEKSFQELERDNKKITEQIGTDDRRDRDRDRSRGGGPRETTRGDSRREAPGSSNRSGGEFSRTENERRGDRRGDDRDRRRDGNTRDREEDSNDDRGRGKRPTGADDDRRGNREVRDQRGGRDDGRWRRDREAPAQRNSKRSREPSPIDDRDMDRSNPKRARVDRERDEYPSRRGGPNRSPEPPARGPVRSSRRGNARR